MLAWGELPLRISSRMRSKISTLASTAMPVVSTMPAIPGSVSARLQHGQQRDDEHQVGQQGEIRDEAEGPVVDQP